MIQKGQKVRSCVFGDGGGKRWGASFCVSARSGEQRGRDSEGYQHFAHDRVLPILEGDPAGFAK